MKCGLLKICLILLSSSMVPRFHRNGHNKLRSWGTNREKAFSSRKISLMPIPKKTECSPTTCGRSVVPLVLEMSPWKCFMVLCVSLGLMFPKLPKTTIDLSDISMRCQENTTILRLQQHLPWDINRKKIYKQLGTCYYNPTSFLLESMMHCRAL